MKERIERWFGEYKERLLMLLGIVLVGVLCFEAGLLQGKMMTQMPVELSFPAAPDTTTVSEVMLPPISDTITSPPGELVVAKSNNEVKCLFVGSKNSNKYHLPTCAVAKRIKPENRVCFASKEAAEQRGYLPSCLK